MPIRMKKIRESAKGQECAVQSPVCNRQSDTVRLIHYRTLGDGAGTGIKPDDTSACYACSDCDIWLGEGNRGVKETKPVDVAAYNARQFYWFRACRRTWALLINNGTLK